MNLNDVQHVHIIGVGGIGVSAIARMLAGRGVSVSGSDRNPSRVTRELEEQGVTVYIGEQKRENVAIETDLVIFSIAVPEDNPERAVAGERGITEMSYPEVLGVLSSEMKTVAVAGTHGKTTTTAMIARGAVAAGLNPMVIVGSLLSKEEGNFIEGTGDLLVVEACEYRRSFLHLSPQVLVITNIEADHLDYYSDIDDVKRAFRTLAEKVPADGFIIADKSDINSRDVVEDLSCTVIDFSNEKQLALALPGEYNRVNAKAALAALSVLGAEREKTEEALQAFSGTWRRFEYHGTLSSGARIYDDYAHHPTEIKALTQGVREAFPDRTFTIIFEPHLFSRTKDLLDDFGNALRGADRVLVAPIYRARETDPGDISHHDVVKKVGDSARAVESYAEVAQFLENETREGEIVFTIGAGPIHTVLEDVTIEKRHG